MYIGYAKYYSTIRFGDDSETVYGAAMIMKNKIVSARFIRKRFLEAFEYFRKQLYIYLVCLKVEGRKVIFF